MLMEIGNAATKYLILKNKRSESFHSFLYISICVFCENTISNIIKHLVDSDLIQHAYKEYSSFSVEF